MSKPLIFDFNPDTIDSLMDRMVKEYIAPNTNSKSKIVIKPDLSAGLKSYESGTIVKPTLIDALINSLNNQIESPRISIVGGGVKENIDTVFDRLGYTELTEKYKNVRLVNLESAEQIKILNPDAKIARLFGFPEELILNDIFISVSTLKRHITERISGCWLNQYSCIPDKNLRVKFQPFIPEASFDMNMLLWPSFNIVDASIALEGTGPVEGYPRYLGKVIFGDNPLVVDMAAASLIGEKFTGVPHLNYAFKKLRNSKHVEIKKFDNVDLSKENRFKLEYVGTFQYKLFRTSLRIKRLSQYLENLGVLFFLATFALVSIGGRDLIRGKWMLFGDYFKIANSILTKVDEPANLFDLKIAINKHVKEESVS